MPTSNTSYLYAGLCWLFALCNFAIALTAFSTTAEIHAISPGMGFATLFLFIGLYYHYQHSKLKQSKVKPQCCASVFSSMCYFFFASYFIL